MTLRPPDCPTAPSAGDLAKSFPVEKLSAAAAGFLIGGESLAYRLDSTWNLIDWRRRRTRAVPGSKYRALDLLHSSDMRTCLVVVSVPVSVIPILDQYQQYRPTLIPDTGIGLSVLKAQIQLKLQVSQVACLTAQWHACLLYCNLLLRCCKYDIL